jgi:DNA repair exonuclease SbcCD nuclease subunit
LRAGYVAWERIVKTALDEHADFVTLGGDVFNGSNPPLKARLAFKEGIEALHEAGIPVFMALGNHDPLDSFPENLRQTPGLHIFGPEPSGASLGPPELRENVVVYGASFPTSVVKENLARGFRREPGVTLAIGLLHANVSGMTGHDDYAPCTLHDLRASGMDVWCLGHVHRHGVLCQEPLVLYAGVSQAAHANEAGMGSCSVVSVEPHGRPAARFVPVAPVLWDRMEMDVSDLRTDEDVVRAVEEESISLLQGHKHAEALVVRITLVGHRDSRGHRDPDCMEELSETLSERLEKLSPPVFMESLRDGTRVAVDLDTLAKEEGVLGDFLRLSRSASSDPELVEDLLRDLEAELSKRQWKRHLVAGANPQHWRDDPHAFEEILSEAQRLVACMFRDEAS